MQKKAAIIGAGIAGIAAAIRLAVKGIKVDVFESNAKPGGKISQFYKDGFRWDTGPSLFTLPALADELFTLAGKDPRHYFRYEHLPIISRYFFEDGTRINAWAEPARFAEEIENKTNDKAGTVKDYLKKSKEKYNFTKKVFLECSLHKPATYFSKQAFTGYLKSYKLKPFRTLHWLNVHHFRDERTVQIFDRFATYNGSNPFEAPAALSIIPHLEHNLGAYYPEGGMYAIIEALEKLAKEAGVNFHYNKKIDKIKLAAGNSKVEGIEIAGEKLDYDLVFSNADIHTTYRNLLKDEGLQKNKSKQQPSSSTIVFYWGMDSVFPQLDLHNVFFSKNYLKEFYDIFHHKKVFDDPTVYIYISSKVNTEDAPKGKENWFVMINVPANSGQDWQKIIEESRWNIIRKLNSMLGENIQQHIVTEAVMDPVKLERNTAAHLGAIYGDSSNNRLAAFLRHPNFSSKIKGLYFCGGTVHPGGGIPLCLLSAKIATEIALKDN